MKKAYFRTCPDCGAALDPDEVCSCQTEKSIEDDPSKPVLDDAILWFEILPKEGKLINIAYRWADEPPKQWYVFHDNVCVAYNYTLVEALLWAFDQGYINLDAVEYIRFANAFYNSAQWQSCREAYKRYRRGLCEKCLAEGKIVAGEHVHHRKRITPQTINDPSVTLSWDNLQLLCAECHREIHSKNKRYRFDQYGHCIIK